MTRSILVLAATLVLPLSVAAESNIPFASGEKLGYEISMLGLRAATAELSIERSGDGWRMFASGRTVGATDSIFGLRQTATCTVEGESLQPDLCRFDSRKRGGFSRKEVRFDRKTGLVRERSLDDAGKRKDRQHKFKDGLEDVQDALSGFYLLRRDLPGPGETVSFRSMRKGKPIRVEAKYLGIEKIETELGTFDAILVDLAIVTKVDKDAATRAKVWFTQDARRLPIRLSVAAPVGSLEAELVRATGTVDPQLARR